MDPLTLEQFTAIMRQVGHDGATTALAARPAAPATPSATDPGAISAQVVAEINALFQQPAFLAGIATALTPVTEAEVHQEDAGASDEAEMGRGIGSTLDSLDNLGGFGIPLGSGFVGIFAGLAASKIVDAFQVPKTTDPVTLVTTTNFINPAIKVGLAWGSMAFLPNLVGKSAANFLAGILVFDALRVVLPIDTWIQMLVDRVKGVGGTPAAQGLRFSRARQLDGYRLEAVAHNLPTAPQANVGPGFGGAGPSPLDYVFYPG